MTTTKYASTWFRATSTSNVQDGERVKAGEPLIDGPINPHDVLQVLGEKELQRYLVDKIQEVYRSQSVTINDKHCEVIVRQMMRSVKIEEVGDTNFLIDEQVDRFRFTEENERVVSAGGRPAIGRPLLLGITKASLSTESFISAASFQETTRVLTEAAISGKVDHLRGLKENVIVGRLIPAGTGLAHYHDFTMDEDVYAPPGGRGRLLPVRRSGGRHSGDAQRAGGGDGELTSQASRVFDQGHGRVGVHGLSFMINVEEARPWTR